MNVGGWFSFGYGGTRLGVPRERRKISPAIHEECYEVKVTLLV